MDLKQQLLESWRRQCKAIDNLATLMTPELLEVKPSEDGWPLALQFGHIHGTRMYWLRMASEQEEWTGVESLIDRSGEPVTWSKDIAQIREQLGRSEEAVSSWIDANAEKEGAAGPYDHPVLYLQHMVWHEGWHAGLIMLGLRLAGHEPDEEWEDPNLWGQWRNYG
jgi:uncharacterized damage-inducible protein DinB